MNRDIDEVVMKTNPQSHLLVLDVISVEFVLGIDVNGNLTITYGVV